MNGKGLKNRRALFVALALVVLGGAAAVSCYLGMVPQAKAQESTTTSSMILMDTVVDVRVDGPRSASLVERVFARMEELERVFSRFIEESEVSEINRRAGSGLKSAPHTRAG